MNLEELYTDYINRTNDGKDDLDVVETLDAFYPYLQEDPKEDEDGYLIVASLCSSDLRDVLKYVVDFLQICETSYDTLCKVDVYRYNTHYSVTLEKPTLTTGTNVKYISKTEFRRNPAVLAKETGAKKLGDRVLFTNILCIGKEFMNNNLYITEGVVE